MAKKAKQKGGKPTAADLEENMLPQNILPIGERGEENIHIYIFQGTYKEIHRFTKNKTTKESGGMLVGTVVEAFGKSNVIIQGFVEAKYCEATPTTLKFTHETWDHVHKEIDKKYKGKKILGWIHTHPDFGIFLSEYDTFIHKNFFHEPYQVAYVVDPIQTIEGFYSWSNDKIEKSKGFYIYDKTGAKIDVDIGTEEAVPEEKPSNMWLKNILLGVLSLAVVLLLFRNISTNKKLEQLEQQQKNLADSANYSLSYIQSLVVSHEEELDALRSENEELRQILLEAGLLTEAETQMPEEESSETEPEEASPETEPSETVGDETEESADESIEGGDPVE